MQQKSALLKLEIHPMIPRTTFLVCVLLISSKIHDAIAFQSSLLEMRANDRSTPTHLAMANEFDNDERETFSHQSRRSLLSKLIAFPLLSSANVASAAPPMTLGESDGLGARAERALRPKPPKILRPKLNQDFAVLLMRSSYNALDEIDCVAMDQFQRDFFLIRQAEYSSYVSSLGPGLVEQGVLTNPYYFDFISFAQYATISREIAQDPPFVFEEQEPVEVGPNAPQKFVTAVIKRDPSLKNEMLASEHDRLVGDAILNRLNELFDGTGSAIPKLSPETMSEESSLASLSQLVKLFLINGFAFDGSVSISKPLSSGSVQFCIELSSPANLWSGKCLAQRRADPRNDFVLKTAKALLRKAGCLVESSSVKYDGNKETSYITVRL